MQVVEAAYTRMLARQLSGTGVIVSACNPGWRGCTPPYARRARPAQRTVLVRLAGLLRTSRVIVSAGMSFQGIVSLFAARGHCVSIGFSIGRSIIEARAVAPEEVRVRPGGGRGEAALGVRERARLVGRCATDMSSWSGPLTAAQGADTPVWLALAAKDAPSGRFWSGRADDGY